MMTSAKISILSYESAAGRTTVALNLFRAASVSNHGIKQLMGFDIERPDLMQCFEKVKFNAEEIYAGFPKIDKLKCKFCGACIASCDCNAIHLDRTIPNVTVDPEKCEACGECYHGCSIHGIHFKERLTGYILQGRLNGDTITIGKADAGHDYLVPLVCAINQRYLRDSLAICDLGPGCSGYVKAALKETTFAVIVQKPSRGWIRNLQFISEMLAERKIPFGLLINKYRNEQGFLKEVESYCQSGSIPLFGIIPFSEKLESRNFGNDSRANSEMDSIFATIWEAINRFLQGKST